MVARRGKLSCVWTRPCRSVLFLSREWPEPSSSAAGVRSYALATAFAEWGWSVSYLRCSLDAPLLDAPPGCRLVQHVTKNLLWGSVCFTTLVSHTMTDSARLRLPWAFR